MKRSLIPVLLAAVALLAVATLAGVGRPEAARGDVNPVPDTVTTTGHGVLTLVPDQANVSAGVHTQAASASEALSRNGELMNRVIAALKQAGGSGLQTQQVSLYPQTGPDGSVTAYVADDSVSATAKIADAGALVAAAVGAGANTVSGPTLAVSDRDARYRDALGKAVQDARAKAEALAKAGGFSVGQVSTVVEQGSSPQPVFEAAVVRGKADSTPVEPGTQDVTADVTVTFRIL
jgi:uncharacterized protein